MCSICQRQVSTISKPRWPQSHSSHRPRQVQSVDGFELREMLSDGRYSRVFRAHDEVGQGQVIIKFPKPLTGADAVLRQAFLREAWIAARVSSPFVCEVLDIAPERRTC